MSAEKTDRNHNDVPVCFIEHNHILFGLHRAESVSPEPLRAKPPVQP